MPRILFTAELEGRRPHYERIARATREHRVDAVVLGGNLTPRFQDPTRSDDLQRRFLETYWIPWLRSIRRSLPRLGVYLVLGNREWKTVRGVLAEVEEKGECTYAHGRVLALGGGFELLGFHFVPPTDSPIKDLERRDRTSDRGFPGGTSRRCLLSTPEGIVAVADPAGFFDRHPSVAEELASLPAPLDPARTIFLCPAPPHGTPLDVDHQGQPCGSRSVRAFIEGSRFLLSLHAQAPDAPRRSGRFYIRLGSTLAVNPGQDFSEWHGVVVDAGNPKSLWHSCAGFLNP